MPKVSKLTAAQVAQLAYDAGFRNTSRHEHLTIAVAVAAGESGWRPHAHALSNIEDSRGLWQINVWAHPQYRNVNLYNPAVNARAAHDVYRRAGGSFRPWSVYIYDRYQQYMAEARAGVRAIGSSVAQISEPSITAEPGFSWKKSMRNLETASKHEAGKSRKRSSKLDRMRLTIKFK